MKKGDKVKYEISRGGWRHWGVGTVRDVIGSSRTNVSTLVVIPEVPIETDEPDTPLLGMLQLYATDVQRVEA